MSDQEFQIANVCLCLQKIEDGLNEPSNFQKLEWAKDAHALLKSIFCPEDGYVMTKGCGRRELFE
jgi:hypothetical protein